MDINLDNLDHVFRYQKPKADQPPRYEAIAQHCVKLAEVILASCPPSRERSLALTHLQETRMWANASIALNEADLK